MTSKTKLRPKRVENQEQVATPKKIRCAIYTRKSTEEGLEQEFNTLDAQRESGLAYVMSQQHEGWVALPEHYDDGGFSGANMDRPAVRRLLADIEAGKIDCVVVYKVDRLSRSLLDFAQLVQTFDKHKVAFVSVTQQFNTSTSMGRLVLNVLLSFAQFEREIISERTRDKIAATRRKGKWSGGWPILGYDVDRERGRLVKNPAEAERVKVIFMLYLELGTLMPVVEELGRRGWLTKEWTTRGGKLMQGVPFNRANLYKLLTNVLYVGKVRYKQEVHPGEHDAIVDPELWQKVQALLKHNGRSGSLEVRNKHGALLRSLIRCVPCDCTMVPSMTVRPSGKRYRYYVCTQAQRRGWHSCPSKSIPAGQIEQLVVQQIRMIGSDPQLQAQVLAQAEAIQAARMAETRAELRQLEKEMRNWDQEVQTICGQMANGGNPRVERLADLQERLRLAERRVQELRQQIEAGETTRLDPRGAKETLSLFELVWNSLAAREQARLIHLLVERIDFDGSSGKVSIAFRSTGIKALIQHHQGPQS